MVNARKVEASFSLFTLEVFCELSPIEEQLIFHLS